MRGKSLMFQGTGSSVGKSMLCAAVCRILKQDGLTVAPFKAQNMALNSYATSEGLEMGRAQVTQAEAAGMEPTVKMNPVLLKPTSDRRSQIIVGGKPIGIMSERVIPLPHGAQQTSVGRKQSLSPLQGVEHRLTAELDKCRLPAGLPPL